ncbi:HAD family hydrolase [Phytoactinopolyspora limicola]|uniref:HAD family hydrolase n=1 Tax=Phytoactinopolyspora limicola TaxID=2715536 RepID=UPI00140E556B|nr:HAD family hydrolase [Phytoactinopolyspora limicola]
MLPVKQNLIFDADDTLWENNILFEVAVDAFIDYVAHPTLGRAEVRERLDDVERANIPYHGYGVDAFRRSLGDCLTALRANGPLTEADHLRLNQLCEPIRNATIDLIEGVAETLHELAGRHQLFLLTKGDHDQQTAKIQASGLAGLFAEAVIVPEKETTTYTSFVAERQLTPDTTWMIGNSPKSDIRPALQAGLGAVLVPHPMTWSLEHADVPRGHDRFREVTPFASLTSHF